MPCHAFSVSRFPLVTLIIFSNSDNCFATYVEIKYENGHTQKSLIPPRQAIKKPANIRYVPTIHIELK